MHIFLATHPIHPPTPTPARVGLRVALPLHGHAAAAAAAEAARHPHHNQHIARAATATARRRAATLRRHRAGHVSTTINGLVCVKVRNIRRDLKLIHLRWFALRFGFGSCTQSADRCAGAGGHRAGCAGPLPGSAFAVGSML